MSTLTQPPETGASDFDALLARRRFRWPRIWRQPLMIIGSVVIALWLLVAIFAPLLEPQNPLAQGSARLTAPSAAHWFGTDTLGRDVLSRIIAGSRVSLPLAIVLVILSMVLGSILGALAGYLGRVVDEVIMRITDLVFAFPTIILAMVVAAALGPGLQNAVLALLLVSWPQYARVMRSMVIGARNNEYVVAGRLLGAGVATSLIRDVLPNVIAPILVLATLDFGNAILLFSGLSFLGLGTVPPTPEWGSMVSDGVKQFSSWWIATFSGMAIFSIVVAFNFLGDSLRDVLDPRSQRTVGGRSI
ncbi:peptide ABC transporter permease [Microlunatus endophyticus]|uniref:Peptide ABC transporter permease n=1 Tax=Microlunatus endophyticus TaxID=1716077 RepID=A0A917SE46_9ACTN|nr:ABC transporter permease [Microlunatus endophyticus]GGL73932.1 peptide ABC transporter permease [Microlunatus endophyticus]